MHMYISGLCQDWESYAPYMCLYKSLFVSEVFVFLFYYFAMIRMFLIHQPLPNFWWLNADWPGCRICTINHCQSILSFTLAVFYGKCFCATCVALSLENFLTTLSFYTRKSILGWLLGFLKLFCQIEANFPLNDSFVKKLWECKGWKPTNWLLIKKGVLISHKAHRVLYLVQSIKRLTCLMLWHQDCS